MGKTNQTRLIRKIELERFLSKVRPHPLPNVNLEQYTMPESTASSMLYLAAYGYDGIVGKRVLDLACGTGRLALGAAFLGADTVVGVDIDKIATAEALKNSLNLGFHEKVDWITGDVDSLRGNFDTVLQNPPFGVQKRNADRKFIQKSLQLANLVFSLHNHPAVDKRLVSRLKAAGGQPVQIEASPFMKRFIEENGGKIEAVYSLLFVIPRMFDFHTKNRYEIAVDLYAISNKRGN